MIGYKIGIIGAGNLGGAIAKGLIASKQINQKNLFVCDLDTAILQGLKKKGIQTLTQADVLTKQVDLIIVAVKPHHVKSVLQLITPHLNTKKQLLGCTAAGVSISDMRAQVGAQIPVFRLMPNTAMSIQQSMTCIASSGASQAQRKQVLSLFKVLGDAVEIPEDLIGPATILGASGIAFALRYIRAAMQAGVEMGFEHHQALQIVLQTVKGATGLLKENGTHPEDELDHVTTPGGVTITGLNEMENKGFTGALIQGILKANQKSIKK